MLRCAKLSAVCLGIAMSGAIAAADLLPANHAIQFEIHETPGDPGTPLLWTYTLRVTAGQRADQLVEWQITQVDIVDVVNGRAWREVIPSAERKGWWIEHADPLKPVDAEFAGAPYLNRVAEPISGGGGSLNYSFHTEGGGAAYVDHAWWHFEVQNGEPGPKGDDRPVRVRVDAEPG